MNIKHNDIVRIVTGIWNGKYGVVKNISSKTLAVLLPTGISSRFNHCDVEPTGYNYSEMNNLLQQVNDARAILRATPEYAALKEAKRALRDMR